MKKRGAVVTISGANWLPVLNSVVPVSRGWRQEHEFVSGRKWRFDFAAVAEKIAIEVEGGAFTGGRHVRGKGFVADMEKYNSATVRGWRALRYTPEQMAEGAFVPAVQQLLSDNVCRDGVGHDVTTVDQGVSRNSAKAGSDRARPKT
jgi:hypothetical protein